MILLLRTDKPESELYLYKPSGELVDSFNWHAHRTLSDTLISKIEQMLKVNHVNKSDLSSIGVYQGPGSFTGLRIGITVANSLAYSLNVPIFSAIGDNWVSQVLELATEGGAYNASVVPHYSSQVHITQPRK